MILLYNLLFILQEEKSPFPSLKLSGGEDILHPDNLMIVADGCNIIKDDGSCDIILGVSLLMAAYWIYGFEYPNVLKKTFSFLEQYVYNLKSTKTISISVVRLHTDLTRNFSPESVASHTN